VVICVLGLTYKPDTSTLRRSAALELINDLVEAGAQVKASDPMADRKELKDYKNFQFFEKAFDALTGADILLLVTPWAEYKKIDFQSVRKLLSGDLVFDTANIWKSTDVEDCGLKYANIGGGKLFGDRA
jgi:UDPglucose 6-dehydrogenase